MPSQHLSLTKTYQAVTTLKATPPPSVRSSLKPPAPPTTADSQPPRKETGLDFALSYAHPGAARIKMTSIVRAHMPGDRSVKQFLLLNLLRSKRRGEKKKQKRRKQNTVTGRVHQAICSVVISARLLEVRRSTMAILWACVGGLVGPHLRETMFQGFRQNHPRQHPHLSSVHVLAVTPTSMLPNWWWNVINLNKPVFSISGPPTDAVFEFEK